MKACVDRLIAAARCAPSADNCQPWRLLRLPDGLRVEFDAERSASGFGPRDPATLLAMGMLIENVIAAADEAGMVLQTRLNAGGVTDIGPAARYLNAVIDRCSEGVAELPRLHPLWRRHTNRFGYRKTALPSALLAELAALGDADARVQVLREPGCIRDVAALVQRGSRLRFRIREVHQWLVDSLRLTPDDVARGDGLDVETLDLPPGGGLLLRLISDWSRMKRLNRLGMYRMLAAVDSRPVAGAPALLAITGAADAHTCLAAGRVLAQAWYRLEAAGVAVQPYYVISDMLERLHRDGIPAPLLDEARTLAADTTRVFGLADGERMLILLRIGFPRRAAPRSRRLPFAALVADA